MKRSTMLLTVAASLAFSPLARADNENMTKGQYQSAESAIEADARVGLSRCDALAANAKDVCVAQVKGNEDVAKAELEARYEPTAQNRNAVHAARAEAAYKVSMQRCDDRAGNEKDVCTKGAEAARAHALSEAQSQVTTGESRRGAVGEKSDAGYTAAEAKCNHLAGTARDSCIDDAKALYGQR